MSSLLSLIASVANFFLPAKYEKISSKASLNSEHMKAMIAVAFIAVYEHEKNNPLSTKEDRKKVFVDSIVSSYSGFKPLKKNGLFAPVTDWEVHYDEKPKFLKGFLGKNMTEEGLIDDNDQALVSDYSAAGYTVGRTILTYIAQQNQRRAIFTYPIEPVEEEESEEAVPPDDDACVEECPESSDSEVDECDVKNFKL